VTNEQPPPAPAGTSVPDVPRGAPCWAQLTARDLRSAEKFYGSVLGWDFRNTTLGDHFAVALSSGRPVAGIAGLATDLQIAVGWTPYFFVPQLDEAAARIRERSATVALGPVAFASGRALLAADRDGAVFGVWDGRLPTGWETWNDQGPITLRLRTRDAFEAAIFYGGVLTWADGSPDHCTVDYEHEEVVVRSRGAVVARLSSGAVEAAPDPAIRPHWDVQFTVADLDAAVAAARDLGGALVKRGTSPVGDYAELRDPEGGLFTAVHLLPGSAGPA
jgi:predicted enzyme related to lactoylglutathione lyase